MKNIASIPKVPSNALDVFRLLPKGTRAEVLNNVLYMSPSLFYEHQQLVTLLTGKLWAYIEQLNREFHLSRHLMFIWKVNYQLFSPTFFLLAIRIRRY